jgi:hypothetical protein
MKFSRFQRQNKSGQNVLRNMEYVAKVETFSVLAKFILK